MSEIEIRTGAMPLVLSFPHTGVGLPGDIAERLVSRERGLRDTDWFIHELYGFVADLDVTTVRTPVSRTVIDVNRDPSGAPLYPKLPNTGLCPVETFDGERLYRPGQEPDDDEIAARRRRWFDPYHKALADHVARLKRNHGSVVLCDCHAVRSEVPRLFDGVLPEFNIGTNAGATCAPGLARAAARECRGAEGMATVVDGRFKGGWITRNYGRPSEGVHAIQLALAMRTYMEEPAPDTIPAGLDPARARSVLAVLRRVIAASLAFAQSHKGSFGEGRP